MKITDEIVDYVSVLAKLQLDDTQKVKAKNDLESILSYMDIINELDTDGIEPMSHTFPVNNVFREDIVTNENNRDVLLSNAPKKKDGCFLVPKTVE